MGIDMKIQLTMEDILNIPSYLYPVMVFSDDLRGFFSLFIKQHQEGGYGHFMWLYKPGIVASQDFPLFREARIEKYVTGRHRVKFFINNDWDEHQRELIIKVIEHDLKLPAYKRMYDFVAIFGQWVHLPWIQLPWISICSDRAEYIKLVSPKYDLKNPDPQDVNKWLTEQDDFHVYGRFIPD